MHGFWFAAMVAVLVAAGVIAQLGWQLPQKAVVKRVFRLDRPRLGRAPTRPSTPAVVAERR